ncbi:MULTISPECIES: alpha/beta fold hydrolase [Legionella]|uniref:Non-ribosomal peptide synthetase/polyketide synthetase n=1 Tax=Legionella drozanskii LLAP-1 TaxID=1212489 RepID=A0A0W0TAI7_9GAMM|nr:MULTISPECIES: alpha/beta fold hydrolase [Legionella]KTC92612.1 non-ribosomal peptide synthetase/polyketide synthetase [Legionella drozanskii LLAP-1]PJE18211.1 MAG: hypothetical protein CK430_00580 [Legionella sp.]
MDKLFTNFTEDFMIPLPETDHPAAVLLVVHGADGSVASFYELARLVGIQLIAVSYQPDHILGCSSIEEFAAVYLKHLTAQYPDVPIILAGHSFGALVAYEMAALLQAQLQKQVSVFLLDPNLPLAMRNYTAERILELRVLASTIFPQQIIEQHDIYHCDEAHLLELLHRCLKPNRLEAILSARKHCLRALSKFVYREHPGVNAHMIHAGEKLGYDFTDQHTKVIPTGSVVRGNHFTMLHSPNVEDIASIINSHLGQYL